MRKNKVFRFGPIIYIPGIILLLLILMAPFSAALDKDFSTVAENKDIALYLDESTTEIAVKNKQSGRVWYSNPAREGNSRDIREIVSINYRNQNGRIRKMDNYSDSVDLDQYNISEVEDGFRIDFTFGDKYAEIENVIPQLISRERFEKFLEQIDNEQDRETVRNNYTLISLEKTEDRGSEDGEEKRDFDQLAKNLFGNYQLYALDDEDKDQHIDMSNDERRDLIGELFNKYVGEVIGVGGNMTEGFRRDIDSTEELQPDDFSYLKENDAYMLKGGLAPFVMEDMEEILQDAGYSIDELGQDHFSYHLDPPTPGIQIFEIPVVFKIEGDSLLVNIPMNEVQYPKEVPEEYKINFQADNYQQGIVFDPEAEETSRNLLRINVLEGMGAAQKSDQGYFMIPDGSGALIEFAEDQKDVSSYSNQIYGPDYTVEERKEGPGNRQQIHLPVFGINKNESGILAIIENGAGVTRIRANIPGNTRPYYTVYPVLETMPTTSSDEGDITLDFHAPQLFREDINLRYVFLEQKESDYTGMGRYYQNYLVENEELEKKESGELPLFLDIIGAVSMREASWGVMREVSRPMTTFSEAGQIVEQIHQQGISNLHFKMSGFFTGGIEHDYPEKVTRDSSLGTEAEFGDLSGLLEEYNYDFYPQVFFQKVFKTSLFDGFSHRIDTARMLNRQIAREYDYDQVYFDRIEEEFAYLAAPAGLEERVKGFYEQLSDHNLRAANLADLGQYVYGDYRDNENRYVDRQGALREIIEQLDYLKNDQGLNLLLENGNAYTFPFTEKIADIPHKSSGYRIFDRDIPFMQIVLQGYFDYTGPPINLTGDYRESLLKNVETGAGLQFRLMAREASVLRKTQFDHLYDVSYQDWEEDVFGWYEEINSKLKPVIGETIIEHKELADNVFLTLFENDTAVVVNYNQQEVEVKGEDIAAQDFIVIDDFDDQGGF